MSDAELIDDEDQVKMNNAELIDGEDVVRMCWVHDSLTEMKMNDADLVVDDEDQMEKSNDVLADKL